MNIQKLTVREGFVFYLLDDRGKVKKRFRAGEKVEIDIESKLFEGQKIKFKEAIDGSLFGEKKPVYKDPVGALSKKTSGTQPPVGAKTKIPNVNKGDEKKREEKLDLGKSGSNPNQAGLKSWYVYELEAMGVEFDKTAGKAELKKLYEEETAPKVPESAEEKLVKVEDLKDGAFPTSAEKFDFSSADEDFLSAWALTLGIDVDEDADLETLEAKIREAF